MNIALFLQQEEEKQKRKQKREKEVNKKRNLQTLQEYASKRSKEFERKVWNDYCYDTACVSVENYIILIRRHYFNSSENFGDLARCCSQLCFSIEI